MGRRNLIITSLATVVTVGLACFAVSQYSSTSKQVTPSSPPPQVETVAASIHPTISTCDMDGKHCSVSTITCANDYVNYGTMLFCETGWSPLREWTRWDEHQKTTNIYCPYPEFNYGFQRKSVDCEQKWEGE